MTDDKILLTPEQAESMLPDGGSIHTFLNPFANTLIGADWTREEVLNLLRRSPQLELGGEMCQGMNHGLVVKDDDRNVFIECRKDLDYTQYEGTPA